MSEDTGNLRLSVEHQVTAMCPFRDGVLLLTKSGRVLQLEMLGDSLDSVRVREIYRS